MEEITKLVEQSRLHPEDRRFAEWLDEHDPLKDLPSYFNIPVNKATGKKEIYLVGNSLGLQAKESIDLVNEELQCWASM